MPKTKPNVFDGVNITADAFFKTHWQRLPYLFRQTTLDLQCLPDRQELFKLAAQHGVQSRIVYSEDQRHFQAIYDEPEAWDEVLDFKPTLLVSDIEKWYPAAQALMNGFPFIKNWRFDDLMMSFAPKGASVGAHTDHYDVFLVQVQGTRQWSYDRQALSNKMMVTDSELAVIDGYQPAITQELTAGDVLYIPPEIPHHGISTSDDCITCSIGLRAPAQAELLTALLESTAQHLGDEKRLKDAVNTINTDAAITDHEINYLKQSIAELNQLSDEDLAECFGQFVTGYRLLEQDYNEADLNINTNNQSAWQKSPFAVFAYRIVSSVQAQLFVNGETYRVHPDFAQLICNHQQFTRPKINNKTFTQLRQNQAIIAAHSNPSKRLHQ